MILGIEIATALMGIYMLCTGKTPGKHDLRHPHFRWLGGFLLTLFPVALVASIMLGLAYLVMRPEATAEQIQKELRWLAFGLEAGVVLLYVVIGVVWERSISKKAMALREAAEMQT